MIAKKNTPLSQELLNCRECPCTDDNKLGSQHLTIIVLKYVHTNFTRWKFKQICLYASIFVWEKIRRKEFRRETTKKDVEHGLWHFLRKP